MTDRRRQTTTDGRNTVAQARPLVRSANKNEIFRYQMNGLHTAYADESRIAKQTTIKARLTYVMQ